MTTQDPVRARIRRLYVPNAYYFITCVTRERRPLFADETNTNLLRATLHRVQEYHPFTMHAFSFMPDHFHLLIFVPETTNISKLMHSVQRNFTRNYKTQRQISEETTLWQRGFWDHVIRSEQDWANHLHYIHYNPVKHGYVSRPEDYVQTSFNEYVKRGWYELGWGHTAPESIVDLDFE
ncbi:MAG: transposase [Anaerolineae bacterium]|nr:transposase [Anaerolineae bacterium]